MNSEVVVASASSTSLHESGAVSDVLIVCGGHAGRGGRRGTTLKVVCTSLTRRETTKRSAGCEWGRRGFAEETQQALGALAPAA